MRLTKGVVFVACAALLAACNSQSSFAPAGPTVASGLDRGAFGATRGTAKMTVQFARDFPDTKYVNIFSNLARLPSGKYEGESSDVITGGGGSKNYPQTQLAGAFTPSGNHTATVIEVAVVQAILQGYGSSGFVLSLNKDDKGVPGKALITAQLPGLPNNGDGWCCAMVVGTIPSGLALTGGQQYWIVLNGQGGQADDAAYWDMNAVDQLHPFLDASYCAYASKCTNGVGWHTFQQDFYGTGVAFAVLGSN